MIASKTSSLLLLICILSACSGLKSIKKKTTTYSYGPETSYARALTYEKTVIYVGNSDGHLYSINLRKKSSQRLTTLRLPELRDIVIHKGEIIGMQSADTSCLLHFSNGNEQKIVLGNTPIFWDGMDISSSGNGILMGDPVADFFSIFTTTDFGSTWTELIPKIPAQKGEAGFAASGSTVKCLNDSTFIFVSGGNTSRFFKSTNHGKTWTSVLLPYLTSPSSGPFSICCINSKEMVVVGGDYRNPSQSQSTSFFSSDGGKSWHASTIPTLGYRSSVIYYHNKLYACGTTGIDVSSDKGKTWKSFKVGNYIALLGYKRKLIASIPAGKIEVIDL